MSWVVDHEPAVRFGSFIAVFALMALWELVAARRRLRAARGARWVANLGMTFRNTIVLRLLFPAAAVGGALLAQEKGWGILNTLQLPTAVSVLASILALDLTLYLQHVMFHAVPTLWRLHMVHHADPDLDVTTGLRFHPLEIVLSMAIKLAVIAALGPSPGVVVVFEVLLNATSMFNHGNVRLGLRLDRALRWLVVTPDMHRVHHSVRPAETNSNFGFNLPWWDRLLGTYRDQPAEGHAAMTIGLERYQELSGQSLWRLLALPFTGAGGGYPIGRDLGP